MINRMDLYRTDVVAPGVKQKAVDFLNRYFPERVPQEAIDDIQYLMDAVREDALGDAKDEFEDQLRDAVDVAFNDGHGEGYDEGYSEGRRNAQYEAEEEIDKLKDRISDLEGMLP